MLTKQQRAHDLAITIVTAIIQTQLDKYPSKTEIFEFVKAYEHAYKDCLESFEENF